MSSATKAQRRFDLHSLVSSSGVSETSSKFAVVLRREAADADRALSIENRWVGCLPEGFCSVVWPAYLNYWSFEPGPESGATRSPLLVGEIVGYVGSVDAIPDPAVDALKGELHRLRRLPPNWDSYGADPPNEDAIELALQALDIAKEMRFLAERVVPSAENGVGLIFRSPSRYADLEFLNTGEISAALLDNERPPETWEVSAEEEDLREALVKIREFIGS